MQKEKVVVTGGRGFIGTHLVKALEEKGYDVAVVDLVDGKDIRSAEHMRAACTGASCVFHLAALPSVQYSIEHPEETHSTNVDGTLSVLIAAHEAGVKRVIFSSSSAVYGDVETLPISESQTLVPKSPYALHKLMGEQYAKLFSQLYNVSTVSLRYFNVYGSGMRSAGAYAPAVAVFLKQCASGGPITITGDGTQTRDFVHVYDVVQANILAAQSTAVGKGEAINIGSASNISMNDIAKHIGGEVVYVEPRIEPHDTLADISLAQKLLGWTPKVSFIDGLSELKKSAGIA